MTIKQDKIWGKIQVDEYINNDEQAHNTTVNSKTDVSESTITSQNADNTSNLAIEGSNNILIIFSQ